MARPVYDRMRQDILDGTLDAGDALVETALAAQYGTSRTPVREALRRLEQDGLIERGSRGMRVRTRDPEEILEIYEVRILLESAAARSAASRHTPFELAQLRAMHHAMMSLDPSDGDALARSNREFHQAVWAMSHNSTLVDLLHRLYAHLGRYPSTTLTFAGRWETVLAEHGELITAIAGGKADEAERIARDHMSAALDIRLRMYVEGRDGGS
jgi:DNA-binding GntR family transcriptional regulator